MSTPAPRHYRTGADTNHFLGLCAECDAHYMLGRSLAGVEDWCRQGMISQDQYEAYAHVWATSAFRYGNYPGLQAPPTGQKTQEHVALLREIIAVRAEWEDDEDYIDESGWS